MADDNPNGAATGAESPDDLFDLLDGNTNLKKQFDDYFNAEAGKVRKAAERKFRREEGGDSPKVGELQAQNDELLEKLDEATGKLKKMTKLEADNKDLKALLTGAQEARGRDKASLLIAEKLDQAGFVAGAKSLALKAMMADKLDIEIDEGGAVASMTVAGKELDEAIKAIQSDDILAASARGGTGASGSDPNKQQTGGIMTPDQYLEFKKTDKYTNMSVLDRLALTKKVSQAAG